MKPGSLLATVVFALVALAHAARLAMGLQVTVDGTEVPMSVSVVGVVVPLALAVLLWRESAPCECRSRRPGNVAGGPEALDSL